MGSTTSTLSLHYRITRRITRPPSLIALRLCAHSTIMMGGAEPSTVETAAVFRELAAANYLK